MEFQVFNRYPRAWNLLLARSIVGFMLFAYLVSSHFIQRSISSELFLPEAGLLCIYLLPRLWQAFAGSWIKDRHIVPILTDSLAISFVAALHAQVSIYSAGFYFLVPLIYGQLYGYRYFHLSGLFGIASFGSLFLCTDLHELFPITGSAIIVAMGLFFTAGHYLKLDRGMAAPSELEYDQAILRIIIGALLTGYFLLMSLHDLPDLPKILLVIEISAVYFVVSSLHMLSICFWPKVYPLRRIIGMFSDNCTISFVLFVGGEAATPVSAMYLWITIGNGFRYGSNYMFISAVMNLVGLGAVYALSDFWHQQSIYVVSLMLVVFAIPAYMATLLKKLNSAIKSANEASMAKTIFLANMSHELRTPLNGVIGISDLLMDTRLDREQRTLARNIQLSAHGLLDMIQQVLDISKIEVGKVTLQNHVFDLHHLIHQVTMIFESEAKRKGLKFGIYVSPEIPCMLYGDQARVKQILINLLGNAVKFTEQGGIVFAVKLVEKEGRDVVRFEVTDTGIGILEGKKSLVFERFMQADESITRKYGGAGLGMAISKQLVNLMNGQIDFVSEYGKGSRFWVDIPFDSPAVHEPLPDLRPQLRVVRLFLLSDETVFGSFEEQMRNFGSTPRWAENFTNLLLQASAEDGVQLNIVVLSDINLSVPAEHAVAMLKNEGMNKNVFFILLTDKLALDSYIAAGFDCILRTRSAQSALYNALHIALVRHNISDKIVPFADYSKAGTEKATVLVAEDNKINQLVIKKILQKGNYKVELVENGEKALDALGRKDYDFLILDMNMPERSGLDVTRAYRFMRTDVRTPIIILTADATPEAEQACIDAGADAYITKPIDSRKLLAAIAELSLSAEAQIEFAGKNSHLSKDSLQIVDAETVKRLMQIGKNFDFIKELLESMLHDGTRCISRAREALIGRDYAEFRDAVHHLKGSAVDMGCVALSRLCGKAETLKPFEFQDKGGKLLANISSVFEQSCKELNRQIALGKGAIEN